MSERWYWKHGRDLLGPLDTAALEQLIRQHRVTDRDQLRLESEEFWLTGAEVKTLFAGGELNDSTSEAAARLLSQSARLRSAGAADSTSGQGIVGRIWRRISIVQQFAGGPLSGLLERCGDLLVWCFRRLTPIWNRYVLLAVVAVALSAVVVTNIHVGSDARNRRIYDELSHAWSELEAMQSRSATEDDFGSFGAALLPNLNRNLEALIEDGKHSPGRSADSFSWLESAERGWEVAHTRKALIQAIQALRAVAKESPESIAGSPSREIFQQNMLVARDLLDGGFRERMAIPTTPQQSRRGSNELLNPTVLGFLVVDGLLIAAGLWYWRRRLR